MADNYLERQYEDYAARKAAWERAKRLGKRMPGSVSSTRRNILAEASASVGGQQVAEPSATQAEKRAVGAASGGAGKRVFITGGASGIGKSIVQAFRAEGCRVAFCDCDVQRGKQTARECGADFYPADVADAEALERCMRQVLADYGDLQVLVHNAGISRFSPLTETSVEDFDRVLAVNLRPAFILSRLWARHRQNRPACRDRGSMVLISSTRYLMSEPGSEAYAASKGGIYALTHALALSLAEFRITVNSIAPGWIQHTGYDRLRAEDHTQHPSGRVGKPEDIARMCVFLSREENDFINGENITIDGGMTKKMIYIE